MGEGLGVQQNDEQDQHVELGKEHDRDELDDLANKYEVFRAK